MRIQTEAQRLAHPQARLIPKSLMNDESVFRNELLDDFIPLMQTQTNAQLFACLRDFVMPQEQRKRKCLWLAVVYSHPHLSKEQLVALAKQIGLSPKAHLEVSIMLNRQDNLAYVIDLPGYAEVIEQQVRAFFGLAAGYGCLGMLTDLASKASPEKLQAMIAADDYWAFMWAAENGHLEVLRYLESKAPAKVQEIIAAGNFAAFRWAAENGHLEVLRYLASKVSLDKVQEMVAAYEFRAFRLAVNNNQVDVLQHLLGFTSVFAYAEAHQREYGAIVIPYLEQQILNLRTRKQAFEQAHPNAVFDVGSDEEGDLFFYYARQLIRRNDPALRDALLLLLELPGVKARAHRAIRGGVPNELLRLALSVNNQMAAELLLAIPAVRQEAEAHDY
ncbi:ankyrin repeat domain-containing protein, partial [Legionella steelei]|uniref:ankyrin repeat domain-containing protein n=3 Tax=Legionella TaxID=445 RepID=UPI001ACBA422